VFLAVGTENWLNLGGGGLQFSVSDAIEQCRHDWMRGALDQCVAYLASGSSSTTPNLMLVSDIALPAEN
jgi:hypothetical protein